MESAQNEKNYAVFSKKQFEHLLEKTEFNKESNRPYIYYTNLNGSIIQITEIFHDPNKKSLFDDAVYFGEIGEFYKATEKPI